ncbi:hypothetical protein [Sphingomonas bisphenolicum]|uniref:Uncharacterized protein n=1 Tax=Sphingomonas bisphenolicum TaxID=296544 RepID=A0ABM7FYK2_9SPHN|nr:hypothetical protein [Sphingomonas bisphenolicum]BBF68818.1 hypothetical protein SBA_ch1_10180 [Sphingomonas bisphenolicum]
MPYYSLRITSGEDADLVELKGMYPDWQPADYTDSPMIYIQRSLDIASLQRNVAGVGEDGGTVEVKKITKREFEWKKHQ